MLIPARYFSCHWLAKLSHPKEYFALWFALCSWDGTSFVLLSPAFLVNAKFDLRTWSDLDWPFWQEYFTHDAVCPCFYGCWDWPVVPSGNSWTPPLESCSPYVCHAILGVILWYPANTQVPINLSPNNFSLPCWSLHKSIISSNQGCKMVVFLSFFFFLYIN